LLQSYIKNRKNKFAIVLFVWEKQLQKIIGIKGGFIGFILSWKGYSL
jgi:hypothetical protein